VPDQHIDVETDAIRDGDTGEPILTRETVHQETARWTSEHPPIPGLQWRISWGIDQQGRNHVRERRLEVIPGWEDAFAPTAHTKPVSAHQHDVTTRADEPSRLGALAYHGWHNALPDNVRQNNTSWDDTPEPFREPLRQAAVLVWQHAENAGFHQALLRTLPSGQLGAAGELENIRDLITAQAITEAQPRPGQKAVLPDQITVNLKWLRDQLTERIQELREQANTEAKRERDARRRRA
jgi:hypothetical protein